MSFCKFLGVACFLCVVKISCYTVFASQSDSESESDSELSTQTVIKKKKSLPVSERIAELERKTDQHNHSITALQELHAYTSGGMRDFSKNVRTDLPLLVSGAASLFYLAIVGYQSGYLDLGTTLSIFVYSYTIFGMFVPKMSGMINTPLNKR